MTAVPLILLSLLGSDSALNSDFASRLGDPCIDSGCTVLFFALPILFSFALWVLTQPSFVLMRSVALSALLRRRLLVISCMFGVRLSPRPRSCRARVICRLAGRRSDCFVSLIACAKASRKG
ncbi:hypothetical protein V8E53_006541 [Lactarius tabidus]